MELETPNILSYKVFYCVEPPESKIPVELFVEIQRTSAEEGGFKLRVGGRNLTGEESGIY